MEHTQEENVVTAREVFLLMKREHRISRNARAVWLLKHLNAKLDFDESEDQSNKEGFEVLSVTSQEDTSHVQRPVYQISSNTAVTFLSELYRYIFVLDLSPSVSTVDSAHNRVLIDDVCTSLCQIIRALVVPFEVPGRRVLFTPNIYISVVAHTPLLNCKANQVLLHGCPVTIANVDSVLISVQRKLEEFENAVATSFSQIVSSTYVRSSEFVLGDDDAEDEDKEMEEDNEPVDRGLMTCADICFINLIRSAIMALQLFPENSAGGIIVITDGIVDIADPNLLQSLLGHLRQTNVSCSFVQLVDHVVCDCGLGQVPYPEMLQFLACATYGAYFARIPHVDLTSKEMSILHKTFLTWNLHRAVDSAVHLYRDTVQDLSWTSWVPGILVDDNQLAKTPLMKKKFAERTMKTALAQVVACRLREGYAIRDLQLPKSSNQLEVRMTLPWRDGVKIHYNVTTAWPVTSDNRTTRVEVVIETHYYFLNDVMTPHIDKYRRIHSPYRHALVKKFRQTMQSLQETDRMLEQLQAFATNGSFNLVPESLKKGIPLFYLPSANMPQTSLLLTDSPQLNIQLRESLLGSDFAVFWSQVLTLNASIWLKWMHVHRIGLCLTHDVPLPRTLQIPEGGGRHFSPVTCRQAMACLHTFLREWSTFMLLENYCYVRMLWRKAEVDKPPSSFYIIRIMGRPPCIVLRIAFLGGTASRLRKEIMNQLQTQLESLCFPIRGSDISEPGGKKVERKMSHPDLDPLGASKTYKPPLQRPRSAVRCFNIMEKPVEKILIRYEKVPQNFRVWELPAVSDEVLGKATPASNADRVSLHNYSVLSRYMHSHRWLWNIQHWPTMHLSVDAAGRVLSVLTSLRLQEGFHFACTSNGIVTMALEIRMQPAGCSETFPCCVQYTLFPPQVAIRKEQPLEDASSDEEMSSDYVEVEQQQLVTECWVEPQYGNVVSSSPERLPLDGATYDEFASRLFPRDLDCLSTMATFEQLSLLCCSKQNQTTFSGPAAFLSKSLDAFKRAPADANIESVPRTYDLLRLLVKCQQVELLFSMFHENQDSGDSLANDTLLTFFLRWLTEANDGELMLKDDDIADFAEQLKWRKETSDSVEAEEEARLKCEDIPARIRAKHAPKTGASNDFGNLNAFRSRCATLPTSCRRESDNGNGVPPNLRVRKDSIQEHSAPQLHAAAAAAESKQAAEAKGPRWRCFVKQTSSSQLFLTFIPATLKDLREFNNGNTASAGDSNSNAKTTNGQGLIQDSNGVSSKANGKRKSLGAGDASPLASSEDKVADFAKSSLADTKDDATAAGGARQQQQQANREQNQPERKHGLTVAAYVYACSTSMLSEQLVNRWTYCRPDDFLQDFTESVSECIVLADSAGEDGALSSSSQQQGGTQERRRQLSGSSLTTTVRSKTISECLQEFKTRAMELDADGSSRANWQQRELNDHCTLVSENFFRSTVKATFYLLQAGIVVPAKDVSAAVNLCEELVPQEVELTDYLLNVCGHARLVCEAAQLEQMRMEDLRRTMPTIDFDAADSDAKQLTGNSVSLPMDSAVLDTGLRCEVIPGLQSVGRRRFQRALAKWFIPVPSQPNVFYLTPSKRMKGFSESSGPDSTVTFMDAYLGKLTSVDSDEVSSEGEDDTAMTSKSMTDDGALIVPEDTIAPLFLYLTCTVRRGGHNSMDSFIVTQLPVCYRELKDYLGEGEIDLNDIRVTLDLIPLTVSTEDNDSGGQSSGKRPCFSRLVSTTSDTGVMPRTQGVAGSILREESVVSFVDETRADADGVDAEDTVLHSLPPEQQQVFMACRNEVSWLLRDEIVSMASMSLLITDDTLTSVVRHIQQSVDLGRSCCSIIPVPLMFVFGADQSFALFREEFEKMKLFTFHLRRQGAYYYLHPNVPAHLRAANSTLELGPFSSGSDALQRDELGGSRSREPSGPDTSDAVQVFSRSSSGAQAVTPRASDSLSSAIDNVKICLIRPSPLRESASSSAMAADGPQGLASVSGAPDDAGFASGSEIFIVEGSSVKSAPTTPSVSALVAKELCLFHQDSKEPGESVTTTSVTTSAATTTTATTFSEAPPTPSSVASPIPVSVLTLSRETPPASSSVGQNLVAMAGGVREGLRRRSGQITGGDDNDRHASMRRAFSSVSFVQQTGVGAPESSSPQQHMSGHQTPGTRSRQQSGRQTPMSVRSTIEVSSRGSVGEEGYEGGSSDTDEDSMSVMGSSSAHQQCSPFWIVIQTLTDKVNIFFHTRETEDESNGVLLHGQSVTKGVASNVHTICHTVNQKLLLEELYKTRNCRPLLIAEADEDVKWASDHSTVHHRRRHETLTLEDDSDSDGELTGDSDRYLAATAAAEPGHFACKSVWSAHFGIHPRLKVGKNNFVKASQILRQVLDKFEVHNRRNIFVFKESTGNVFYMRLTEATMDGALSTLPASEEARPSTKEIGPTAPNLDTFPMIPGINDEVAFSFEDKLKLPPPPIAADEVKTTSASAVVGGATRTKPQDCMVLTVFGVSSVGSEISTNLLQVLQKKLDDAVLEMLLLALLRNSMTKLTVEDVQFIQMPYTKPTTTILLSVPACALHRQMALCYYICQHLSVTFIVPNYADVGEDNAFKDYTQTSPQPMAENSVYLYLPPKQAPATGIACVHMSCVDGRGHPVSLLPTPKPSPLAYYDIPDAASFDDLITTSVVQLSTDSRTPGPTTVLRFNLWERGSGGLSSLIERLLVKVVTLAACDLLMEYELLTAPLCHVSHQLRDDLDKMGRHAHSAPASPFLGRVDYYDDGAMSSSSNSSVVKAFSRADLAIKSVPADMGVPQHRFSFSDISKLAPSSPSPVKELPKSALPAVNIGGASSATMTTAMSANLDPDTDEVECASRADLLDDLHCIEKGLSGQLNSQFIGTIRQWLDAFVDNEVTTVSHVSLAMADRFPQSYIVSELPSLVTKLYPDLEPKLFHRTTLPGGGNVGDGRGFKLVQPPQNTPQVALAPLLSAEQEFVCIGRNVEQWRASLDRADIDDLVTLGAIETNSKTKTSKGYQRFKPFLPPERCDQCEVDEMARPPVIPRQRLFLAFIRERQLTVYTYNWLPDVNALLREELHHIAQWHNARSHLLSCILHQKMGLFYHQAFTQHPPDLDTGDHNPFLECINDADLLIRHHVYPSAKWQAHVHSSTQHLAKIYENAKPPRLLTQVGSGGRADILQRHGFQMYDIWHQTKTEKANMHKVRQLFGTWLLKHDVRSEFVAQADLEALLAQSTLKHSVAAPLLFSARLRKKLLAKPDAAHTVKKVDTRLPNDTKIRSRHSSGSSVGGKDRAQPGAASGAATVQELRKKSASNTESPDVSVRRAQEEEPVDSICAECLQLYMQYLHAVLAFNPIQLSRPSPPGRSVKKQPSQNQRAPPGVSGGGGGGGSETTSKFQLPAGSSYLQKTQSGGSIIIELCLRDSFLCVSVYSFDVAVLRSERLPSQQVQMLFRDEVDRVKDLTHLNSFVYDLHLSFVNDYVSNVQQSLLRHGYHVFSLLNDMATFCVSPPLYTSHLALSGELVFSDTCTNSQQLFAFMLQYAGEFNMRVISLVGSAPDDDDLPETEHALVITGKCGSAATNQQLNRVDSSQYVSTMILTMDQVTTVLPAVPGPGAPPVTVDRHTMRLRYWLLLVNVVHKFPVATISTASPADSVNSAVAGITGSSSGSNLLTASQLALAEIIAAENDRLRAQLQSTVRRAVVQNRRDTLWQRMLVGDRGEEGVRRKHRSDAEDAREAHTQLSFGELTELLGMVTVQSVSEIDPGLASFRDLPLTWHQALSRYLQVKYPDQHRRFSSPDGQLQHLIILNPRMLDMCMLVTVDMTTNSTAASAVFKKESQSQSALAAASCLSDSECFSNSDAMALIFQEFFEDFVSACSYHLWSSLVLATTPS